MGLDPSKESKSIRLESDRLKNDWDAASKIVVESTSTSKVEDASEDAQVEPGEEQEVIETNETDTDMMALMGFGGFDTTKGKPVQGNQEGAVDIKKQRTWRQYMNRRGGFNRPLDKIK
ncbi:hypothetical protein K439DRAFT_1651218 [Ramaria rubella]|nr:hypothetical protein K439DRAFT_1651218 [Ramaria rubella]